MIRRRAAKEATLSQRDQALLRLSRLMAENPPPGALVEPSNDNALINVRELADTTPGPPPRRPGPPAPPRPHNPLWRALEILVIMVVVVWVFLLGVLVGRSRLGEDGQWLAGWMEKKISDAPAVIIKPAPEALPVSLPLQSTGLSSAPPPMAVLEADSDEDSPGPEALPDPEALPGDEITAEPQTLFSAQAALAHGEDEARKMVNRLAEQGFTAYFYQSGRRFPVRVGPFSSRGPAEEARRQLEGLGYNRPFVSELR